MKKTNFLDECKKIIFKNIELFQILEEYDKTHKLRKLEYKERANFTINSKILRRFREYCKKGGYSMSKLVENFMKKQFA